MTIFRCSVFLIGLIATSCSREPPAKRCAGLEIANVGAPRLSGSWLEQGGVNNNCVKGWAYKLSAAPGANRDVADAATQACASGIEYEAAQLAERDLPENLRVEGKMDRDKELTGKYAREALLSVVRARAGQCEDK